MPTVLITGASRGLGFEMSRQYAADGWAVVATCRSPESATNLTALAADNPEIEVHALDVTDHAAIRALAEQLANRPVDVLLNNAGRLAPEDAPHSRDASTLGSLDYAEFDAQFRVNVLGPLAMAEAFLPHVGASEQKKIIAISSRVGSMACNTSGGYYPYRVSKAGLNAAMTSLAIDVKARGIAVAVLHPGWVRTDMGGPGADVGVVESATGLRQCIAGLTLATTGCFLNYEGDEIPW